MLRRVNDRISILFDTTCVSVLFNRFTDSRSSLLVLSFERVERNAAKDQNETVTCYCLSRVINAGITDGVNRETGVRGTEVPAENRQKFVIQ